MELGDEVLLLRGEQNSLNERNVLREDSRRMRRLHEQILAENRTSSTLLLQFLSMIEDVAATGCVAGRGQQIKGIYKSAAEVKTRVGMLLVALRGTQFRVPLYNEEVRAYETFLADEISTLETIESFSAAYLSGDAEGFAAEVKSTEARFSALLQAHQTMLARQQSLERQLDSTITSNLIEVDREAARARRQRVKGLFHIIAVCFSLGYVVFVCAGVRNSARQSRRQVPRPSKAASARKQRKKNRKNY